MHALFLVVHPSPPPTLQKLAEDGFAIVEDVLSAHVVDGVLGAVEMRLENPRMRLSVNMRSIAEAVPEVAELTRMPAIRALAEAVIRPGVRVARSLWFDKTPAANWKVAWHQDLTIAVQEKRDVPGFGSWSLKDGIPHVQPPSLLLERMITLRIHLDDCDASNGALKVLPGSHREGKLAPSQIKGWRQRREPVTCEVRKGGVLLMRPLLLHASSPATNPSHRRVVHVEFAADELPGGLRWLDPPSVAARRKMTC
jgi:ectoine hydroxylase-related dioxygenase (phytanoyl-CoA dioxygenase family)